MRYPTKKQSFSKEKECFFVRYLKFFWPFLFWKGFNNINVCVSLRYVSSQKQPSTDVDHPSLARAPPDCNQYHTGQSGTVVSYNWPNIQLVSKTHNICIRRELGKTFYHKTIEMWNSAKFAFIFSSINLFHLLFTEIFCTKGHRNFCTEAFLHKCLYPSVQKISVKNRWNKLLLN